MKLIFNPFVKIAGLPALSFGTLFLLVGAMAAGFFKTRFDGVLDLHFGQKVSFSAPLYDQILVWLTLVAVFYPMALILGARPRLLDIAGTFALARLPYAALPLLNCTGFISKLSLRISSIDPHNPKIPFSGLELGIFIPLIFITIAFSAWLVVLYFNAYKTCTNFKGSRLIVSFISGILIAEIISVFLTRNLI